MTKQTKAIVSIVAILALATIGMVVLTSLKKDPPKKPPKEFIRYVKTRKVAYSDIESRVMGSGRLASIHQVDVIGEVQGKILPGDVPLKKGQAFKTGELLFRIFDKEARLGLLAKKSRFLNAIANLLPDFKVDYPDSYPEWTGFLGSIDVEKDIPPLPEIKSDKEKIFLAGRNILSEYYSIKSDEVRLKKYSIHAPFAGSYTDVFLEVGAVANPGTRVGRIIRTDKLEVEVPIKVNNARWISLGDRVQVTGEDGAGEWTGKVARKSSFVDPGSQSVSIFVLLDSASHNPLLPGLYLKTVFPGIMVDNAMEIPRNAVFNTNEVFVVQEGRLAKRLIDIRKVDETTLIFSGLQEGADVVVEPLVNATENEPVEILGANKTKQANKKNNEKNS